MREYLRLGYGIMKFIIPNCYWKQLKYADYDLALILSMSAWTLSLKSTPYDGEFFFWRNFS